MLVMNKKALTVTTILFILFFLTLSTVYIRRSPITDRVNKKIDHHKVTSSGLSQINDKFEILEVKTGLDEASVLWFPKIFVRVKNISGSDLTEKHKIQAVFINDSTLEIIDNPSTLISNTNLLFPKQTNQKFELRTFTAFKPAYKKDMKDISVSVKLFLDGNLMGIYPLKNQTIKFTNF